MDSVDCEHVRTRGCTALHFIFCIFVSAWSPFPGDASSGVRFEIVMMVFKLAKRRSSGALAQILPHKHAASGPRIRTLNLRTRLKRSCPHNAPPPNTIGKININMHLQIPAMQGPDPARGIHVFDARPGALRRP